MIFFIDNKIMEIMGLLTRFTNLSPAEWFLSKVDIVNTFVAKSFLRQYSIWCEVVGWILKVEFKYHVHSWTSTMKPFLYASIKIERDHIKDSYANISC